MKSIIASIVALGVATSFAQQLTINTPNLATTCQPLLLTWSGGTPQYFLTILPGSDPTGNPILTFNPTGSTSVTWFVNQAAGISLGLTIRDSTGATAQSAPFTIVPGPDNSCVGGNTTSISFGSTAASAPTSVTSASGTSPATTTSPSTGSGSSASAARSSGSAARSSAGSSSSTSATSTRSAAASRVNGQVVVAGIIGAAMVALLG